ncbi:SpoIIE family protein phosphatase [Streptomyces sp. NPDC093228]|uniref:SpoIIE family protein phosphatase n=1 Tax=unclassified Streptomyces TaxID=2593676 RepID=UPI000E278D2F|nr:MULTISPECIES: SpoIIE family protein phosphatase [unclassified Streptomyces]MDX3258004.1 SpoIIE family protein phosphatase [Streptomyces sp. MI02-2A]REE60656.1 serine phosphatase RsbU (regulator of sigma subunit) [Streptomyces sp. 3212.3]
MGAIPTQRETISRAPDVPVPEGADLRAVVRTTLPGGPLAAGAARRFVRAALEEWARTAEPDTFTERLADDTLVVVSELVTNAVVHAGTDVDVACRLKETEDEPAGLVVEVSDHHPSRAVRDDGSERPYGIPEYGRGLRLVSTLSTAWGITYRTGTKTVWALLPLDGARDAEDTLEAYGCESGPSPAELLGPDLSAFAETARGTHDRDWRGRGALSFLAEASDLLAGQLDEDLVAALTGQLIVPRLADWCAVWLEDEAAGWQGPGSAVAPGTRLARVWHGSENRIEELRRALEKDPPRVPDSVRSRAVPVPWPGEALGPRGATGAALAYRLIAGGRPLGTLVIGRAGLLRFPDEVTGLVEDLSRRVALAIGAARQYARQATISRVLQRGLLPGAVAEIPGLRSALVYEPCDKGGPSGDFYDIFPAGDGRWCFALGDVQGKGPEAAVVIGLARPWLRLLAREGYAVPDVLDRLNQLLLDDATEAADAAARALVAAGAPVPVVDDGPHARFLSLLYGELVPFEGGMRCTLASAGHPLPLALGPTGDVRAVARPQTLLGVVEDVAYACETFELHPGDTLLCVTDGVTERRSGPRQFDDGDGLAAALTGCAGLSAQRIAERIRRLVHDFGAKPPEDDLALLVLQAE